MADHKRFLEIRVTLADREGRPMDLSHAMADLALKPAEGPAVVQAMQLMSPAPGSAVPVEPEALPPTRLEDGLTVRAAVLRPSKPVEAPGGATAYFTSDVEAPPGGGAIDAKLKLTLPQGTRVVDLRIPADGK